MTLNVCPASTVAAPVEVVWDILTHLENYGEWADGQVGSVEPPGSAMVGQKMTVISPAFGRKWRAYFTVEKVDPDKHQLETHVILPLRMQLHEHISCTSIDATSCRVQYG